MSSLTLKNLSKSFGEPPVVRDVSLTIEEGEFVSLLGPSGCGKTTILRMVAGLAAPDRGLILIGDEDVTRFPPNRRNLGLVFQSYALFPHLTVFENVAFGLRRRKIGGAELDRRVAETLARVRLDSFGERYPRQLSGGQQQRVAIARALAPQPRVLLFDEPLSNLDAQLRDAMQIELKRLQRELRVTTLFVTHDQAEALSMSDRVGVMARGVVQQLAAPEDIYHRPTTAFVASFIGKPNRLSGVVSLRDGSGGRVRIGAELELAAIQIEGPVGATVDVIVRQEAIAVRLGRAAQGEIDGRVVLRSFSGARVQVVVRAAGGVELIAEAPSSGAIASLAVGDAVALAVPSTAVFAMAPEAGGP